MTGVKRAECPGLAEILKGSHGLKNLMQWRWRATRVVCARFGRGEIGNKLRRMTDETDEAGTHIIHTHLADEAQWSRDASAPNAEWETFHD